MSASRPTYTQEEVTEILKRALRQQSMRDQGLSHDQLLEMADEVGIDRAALETAAGELERVRADELVRSNESRELTEERSRLFVRFVSSLLTYLVVNVALYFLDRQLTGGAWLSYWVMFVWGLGLLFQLRNVLFPAHSLQRRKRRELKLAEREQRRAEREERRRRMHQAWNGGATPMFQAGAKEFESAVQAGVDALLSVAARKIHEHASKASEGPSDGSETPRRRR